MSGDFVSTTNACKLCTPLGACLAFKGVEGCVPFLHGSQGCATYMRRYVISHFREPMDIASSALGEKQAVFGGGPNLKKGLLNVMRKYAPAVIGVATTCLTETIGDDVARILAEFRQEFGHLPLPAIAHASTPSYSGTHMEGWRSAVKALASQLVEEKAPAHNGVNLFPGLLSPADIRHLGDLVRGFGLEPCILPDLSEALDGPAAATYQAIADGGTPLSAIRAMSGAAASLDLGWPSGEDSAGANLDRRFGVPCQSLPAPIGLRATDQLCAALAEISGRPAPRELELERGRLADALVDGHKYVYGKRAVVYGEEDLVIGLTSLLAEIGVHPVLCATGAPGKGFAAAIARACDGLTPETPRAMAGADFHHIAEAARDLAPDLLLGHSKGYKYAREWNIPLIRAGFPIHDRFGGQRLLHVGYAGALALYDRVVNAVLEKNQSDSPVGYSYL